MKYLILCFFFASSLLSVYAQEYYDLSGLHALKNHNGDVFFELSGYEITTTSHSGKIGDLTVSNELKSRFGLDSVFAEYSDTEMSVANKIIEAESEVKNKSDEKQNQILYIIGKDEESVTGIFFQTYNQRDVILEQVFVDAYINGKLEQYIKEDWSAHRISFIGQELFLGNDCKWQSPHNVSCGDAQLKWSEFSSYESALLDINNRIRLGNSSDLIIVSEGELDVLFENIPSVAYRVVSYHKADANKLVAYYYIAQEVDGRFVSCTLSNPVEEKNDYRLAPLLLQMMSIPQLPDDAYVVNEDTEEVYNEDDESERRTAFEVIAGSWVPMGNLNDVFAAAPSFGFFLGFPVSDKVRLGLDMQLAIPVSTGKFDYYKDKETFETKAEFVGNISFVGRYKTVLSKEMELYPYLGLGVNILQTDLKEESFDEEDDISSVVAPDLHGGVSLTYKKFGVFMEYHYVPYSAGNKVPGGFGNSYLSLGLSYSFFID